MTKAKVRSDLLKRALSDRHKDDFFLTEVKTGATHTNREMLKFDAMAVKKSWANPCISGYEIKVDRSDFLRDNKWPGYMAYCNQFSFVCPSGLISLDELPSDVGLIYYNPEKQSLLTKRKALYRNIQIPESLLYYLIMNRLENDRHPFFSSNREYVETYLSDKEERRRLGKSFGIAITEDMQELRQEKDELKRKIKRDERDVKLLEDVSEILNEFGIRIYSWNDWKTQLRSALAGKANPIAAKAIVELAESANRLREMFEEKTDEPA